MEATEINNKLQDIFKKDKETILSETTDSIRKIREEAFDHFVRKGIPTTKEEEWRHTNISTVLNPDYVPCILPNKITLELNEVFRCDVPNLDTCVLYLINGWFPENQTKLNYFPDGSIMGSLYEAIKKHPDIVEKYYNQCAGFSSSGLADLNNAFARDGIFIYVPDHVVIEKPVQIINVVSSNEDILVNHRNLFIAGKNSSVKIVICDHSLYFNKSFINSVTEIPLAENASVEFYRVQNSSNNTAKVAFNFIEQQANSRFNSNFISLHGGFIRNNIDLKLAGKGGEAKLHGLFVLDREQHVDNTTYIEHCVPDCTSSELYKGILDDKSRGVFNGKILVKPDAQRTNAFQTNKNILLTDEALMNTRPQLEIYADDVKCSHGATIGQLDSEALFYLRSRGIPEAEARMMLMYAFASEVFNKISIDALRDRIDDLVSKRLRGELSRCNHCKIQCG